MRERARAYGGDCTVDSAPGAGTRVHLRLPA
jgi:signal transduction histidine kinase